MEEMVLRFEERWCFEAGVSLQVILLLQELLQLRKKKNSTTYHLQTSFYTHPQTLQSECPSPFPLRLLSSVLVSTDPFPPRSRCLSDVTTPTPQTARILLAADVNRNWYFPAVLFIPHVHVGFER